MVSLNLSMLSSTMLLALVLAMPVVQEQSYSLRTVHQFPNHTWIENMAIRCNGQILGTNLAGGNVFLVDPKKPQSFTPPVLAFFGNDTAMEGIAEVEDDVFYVAGTRNSKALAFQFPANTSAIWKIDLRNYDKTGHARVDKVADIPSIALPNGLTLLSKSAGTILIADSAGGKVWRFSVRTGQYEVVIDDEVLKPVEGMFPSFGVNGVRVIGSTLYFSNFNKALIGTIPISRDGRPTGIPRLISSNVTNIDDFAVGNDGSIWAAQNVIGRVSRVFPNGKIVTVAGGPNSTALVGPVSARFGRTLKDQHVLYISTDGLKIGKGGVPLTSDGKIAALDTRKMDWKM